MEKAARSEAAERQEVAEEQLHTLQESQAGLKAALQAAEARPAFLALHWSCLCRLLVQHGAGQLW